MAQLSTSHVFMSYSRRDEIIMRRVVASLRKQGIKVWLDNERLVPGTPIWEAEIERAIMNAGAVVVLLSPDSKNSPWVRREISYAEDNDKRIFPVFVAGNPRDTIPIRLTNHQRIDIRENEEVGLNSLATTISFYLEDLQAQEKKALEEVEKLSRSEEEKRRAAEKIEMERLVEEKAQAERRAKEKAEHLAKQKANMEGRVKEEIPSVVTREMKKEIKKKEQGIPSSQTKPVTKLPLIPIGIGGMAILGILLCGYAAVNLLRGLSTPMPPATEAPAETEAIVTELPTTPPTNESPLACTPNGTGPISFSNGGKSVTGAWSQEPDFINPYYSGMAYSIWLTQLTLVGLGEWDEEGNFVPELATKVPTVENGGISSDGLTITWKLKPCLFWSDGKPITSGDVAFTWESVMDSRNTPYSRIGYEKIASVETPDDQTVVINFNELYPPWQTLFTQGPNNSGSILPKHILDGKTGLENDPFIHQPTISSGPFVITEWVAGDHIMLLPNPNFYKGRAKLDQVIIRFVPDSEAALTRLQSGNADWSPDFSTTYLTTLTNLEPNIHLGTSPDNFVLQYFFNLGTTTGINNQGQSDFDGFCPFQDYRVRKAIIVGIDRQAIVHSLLEDYTTTPGSLWPNSAWNNDTLLPEAYDPELARQLLDEAGYVDSNGDGIREGACNSNFVQLSINFATTTVQLRKDIAQMVKADLSQIGVDFQPNHISAGTFYASYSDNGTMTRGDFDMASYPTGYYPDPSPLRDFLCNYVPSSSNPDGFNYMHICDPNLEELITRVDEIADPLQRKQALDAVQQYLYDNALIIPIYTYFGVYGYADRFLPALFSEISGMGWNAEEWDVR